MLLLFHSSLRMGSIPLYVCMYVKQEGMATHFSILAWRIPWTEEPGGLQSTGLQRVKHNRATKHSTAHVSIHTYIQNLLCSSLDGHLLARSYGSSIFSFYRSLHIFFFTLAVPVYIPTNSARGFPFLHTFSSICCL